MSRMPPDRAPARGIVNDRFVNVPDAQGMGVISIDAFKVEAVHDAFDKAGQPIIGYSTVYMDSGNALPVQVGRHQLIFTLLAVRSGGVPPEQGDVATLAN